MLLGRAITLISSLPGIKSTNSIKDVCPQWVQLLRQEPFLEQWTLTTTTRKGSFWIIKFQELKKKKKRFWEERKGGSGYGRGMYAFPLTFQGNRNRHSGKNPGSVLAARKGRWEVLRAAWQRACRRMWWRDYYSWVDHWVDQSIYSLMTNRKYILSKDHICSSPSGYSFFLPNLKGRQMETRGAIRTIWKTQHLVSLTPLV